MKQAKKPVIALVLGGGAARGWAHIGVIHELADMGVVPDMVVGTSVGSIVGGAYASGNLEQFEQWISGLGRVDIIRLLDAKMTGGGFLQGNSLMSAIKKRIGDPKIEDLDIPFACVATELGTGREVWLREGSLLDACRASIALPGMFAPSRMKEDQAAARRRPGQPGAGVAGARHGWRRGHCGEPERRPDRPAFLRARGAGGVE